MRVTAHRPSNYRRRRMRRKTRPFRPDPRGPPPHPAAPGLAVGLPWEWVSSFATCDRHGYRGHRPWAGRVRGVRHRLLSQPGAAAGSSSDPFPSAAHYRIRHRPGAGQARTTKVASQRTNGASCDPERVGLNSPMAEIGQWTLTTAALTPSPTAVAVPFSGVDIGLAQHG
jgi:hypothetical protein